MTIERRPWLGFLNTETGRREARTGLTIGKIYTVEDRASCVDDDGARRSRPAADWGDPVARQLARDELYMRLRNDAGLSHQHATAFLAACPDYAEIRHALARGDTTGEIMGRLVVWSGKMRGGVYRDAARRCGWSY